MLKNIMIYIIYMYQWKGSCLNFNKSAVVKVGGVHDFWKMRSKIKKFFQCICVLTKNVDSTVSREFEPHQRFLLFPWASMFYQPFFLLHKTWSSLCSTQLSTSRTLDFYSVEPVLFLQRSISIILGSIKRWIFFQVPKCHHRHHHRHCQLDLWAEGLNQCPNSSLTQQMSCFMVLYIY